MRTKIIITSSLLWTLTAGVAMAAPYCAVFGWGKLCDYQDLNECLRAVGREGGCELNPQKDQALPGTSPFCLVTPSGSQCIYDDAPACRMAAAIQNSKIVTRAECRKNSNP